MTVAQDIVTPVPTDEQRPDLYKILLVGLIAITLIVILLGSGLSFAGKNVPEQMWSIGIFAVGALAGMLAPRVTR